MEQPERSQVPPELNCSAIRPLPRRRLQVVGMTTVVTEDQYNSILAEFYERFVKGITESVGVSAALGKTDKAPADYMSDAAVDRLERFSLFANKSTGSGHPADQERWFDFRIQIHNDQRGPDPSTLVELLKKYFEWPDLKASELAFEYEFGRALLSQAYRR